MGVGGAGSEKMRRGKRTRGAVIWREPSQSVLGPVLEERWERTGWRDNFIGVG